MKSNRRIASMFQISESVDNMNEEYTEDINDIWIESKIILSISDFTNDLVKYGYISTNWKPNGKFIDFINGTMPIFSHSSTIDGILTNSLKQEMKCDY